MGKLHTLRRAIERDPSKFYKEYRNGRRYVKGAWRWRGEWGPTMAPSFRSFVRHVLKELGEIDD